MKRFPKINRKLKKAANIVIKDCLGVKRGERVVVVTDEFCYTIGYTLWQSLKKITDPILIKIVPRKIHGQEPPKLVTEILKNCDVYIIPTYYSLTHTRARIEASKQGARGTTMPGITVDVMTRALNANYQKIAVLTNKIARLLSKAKKVIIKTDKGTNLKLSLAKRQCHIDTGIIKNSGEFSNLPAGEAFIAPIENKSNGIIVVDGSFAPIGFLNKPVVLEINQGKLVKVKGTREIDAIFRRYGKREKTLCEFGIGTNPKAKITGNVLEDEKVLGSIHVAFGNNLGFGGINKARIHLDGVIKKPSVWLDEKLIIKKGTLLI